MAGDRYEYSEKRTSPGGVAAFVKLFDKYDTDSKDPSKKTWSVNKIYTEKSQLKVFEEAFEEAAKKMWGDKAANMVKHKSFKSPFKDGGDKTNRDGELYAGFEEGQFVVTIKSSNGAPGVVDRKARKISDLNGTTRTHKGDKPDDDIYEELEENALYSGMVSRETFVAMAYDRSDGFGITFKLENLQKIGDGERLGGGGRSKPEDDFEPVDGDDEDMFA